MRRIKPPVKIQFIALGVFILTAIPLLQSYLGFKFMQNQDTPFNWGVNIIYRMSDAVVWALLFGFIYRFFIKNPLTGKFWQIVKYLIATITFCSIQKVISMVLMLFLLYFLEGEEADVETWLNMVLSSLPREIAGRIPEFMLIGGAILASVYYRQSHQKEVELLKVKTELSDAKLSALKAQLQPHFLFNAMNSVSSLMDEEVGKARRLLARLADLLATMLDLEDKSFIRLSDEISWNEDYLEIQSIRFGDQLKYAIHMAPETTNLEVPALILQPILENSIKHNLAKGAGFLQIKIATTLSDGKLLIQIEDFTEAHDMHEQSQRHDGKGLVNIRSRLNNLYGDDFVFTTNAKGDAGYKVELKLPIQ